MALGYVTTLRNNMLNQVASLADAGSSGAHIKIYTNPRPATGASAGAATLLAELIMSDPAFGSASAGVITANAIANDENTNASGTATWFRIEDSNGTAVLDGSVGLTGSGAELEFGNNQILINQELRITSFAITEGNA